MWALGRPADTEKGGRLMSLPMSTKQGKGKGQGVAIGCQGVGWFGLVGLRAGLWLAESPVGNTRMQVQVAAKWDV